VVVHTKQVKQQVVVEMHRMVLVVEAELPVTTDLQVAVAVMAVMVFVLL
jgi:hypothetical protein